MKVIAPRISRMRPTIERTTSGVNRAPNFDARLRVREAVERVIASIATPGDHISEIALLKTQVKDGVSRYLYEQTKRRPMVFPVVVEV